MANNTHTSRHLDAGMGFPVITRLQQYIPHSKENTGTLGLPKSIVQDAPSKVNYSAGQEIPFCVTRGFTAVFTKANHWNLP
jgi:hypothetical protein